MQDLPQAGGRRAGIFEEPAAEGSGKNMTQKEREILEAIRKYCKQCATKDNKTDSATMLVKMCNVSG
jgi:hypothetical protein